MADPPVPPPADPKAPAPNQPAPNQPAPNQPAPNQPAPNQSAPNQPAPNQPAPNQPAPNQPALIQIAQAAPQIMHQPTLNWSLFKSDFFWGRPQDDVEAYLLHTNDWMETHNFQQEEKMQRFCLTLIGEARLWYESLRPIVNAWPGLQENFRQQNSKIGNTREQLFHAWRPFHYDENTETVDVYVNRKRQVVAMLGYGEPQNLEIFKNTIPNRLYWILYPIDNLRVAVETATKLLTKEKIDRQMSGQSSTMPFMRMHNESNYPEKGSCKKGVTF